MNPNLSYTIQTYEIYAKQHLMNHNLKESRPQPTSKLKTSALNQLYDIFPCLNDLKCSHTIT